MCFRLILTLMCRYWFHVIFHLYYTSAKSDVIWSLSDSEAGPLHYSGKIRRHTLRCVDNNSEPVSLVRTIYYQRWGVLPTNYWNNKLLRSPISSLDISHLMLTIYFRNWFLSPSTWPNSFVKIERAYSDIAHLSHADDILGCVLNLFSVSCQRRTKR